MAADGWRPGSRLERIRASHSYGFVLGLIAVTYVVIVAAPETRWSAAVLILIETFTLAIALWTSGLGWAQATVALTAIAAALAIVEILVAGTTTRGLAAVLDVLLVAATSTVLGLGVFDQRSINRQSVTGAVCVYLLIGIFFMYLYGAVASFDSGAFFAQGTDGSPATRVYFSYVTLATLGYGDYTPAGQPGRSFAIVEALLGQLYLVTVVALLVGRFGGQLRREPG